MPKRQRCRIYKPSPCWRYRKQLDIVSPHEQTFRRLSHFQVQVSTPNLYFPYQIEQTERTKQATARQDDYVPPKWGTRKLYLAHTAYILEFSCMTDKRHIWIWHIQENNETRPTQCFPSTRVCTNARISRASLTVIEWQAAVIHSYFQTSTSVIAAEIPPRVLSIILWRHSR